MRQTRYYALALLGLCALKQSASDLVLENLLRILLKCVCIALELLRAPARLFFPFRQCVPYRAGEDSTSTFAHTTY